MHRDNEKNNEMTMDTMTIAFDDRKMISVLRQLINSMNGVRIIPSGTTIEEEKSVSVSKVKKYRISPLIKSMETGIKVSEDISDDYKKEIGEIRAKRGHYKRYSCDAIVTRNPRDFIKSDILVLTPDEVIKIIDK